MADEQVPEMYEVQWKGKTHYVTRDDYDAVKASVFDRLRPYVDTLSTSTKLNLKIHKEYIETAEQKEGFLKAVSLFVVMNVGNIRMPSDSLASKATAAMAKLDSAMSGKKIMDVAPALEAAEAAINAYRTDTERFLTELSGTAYKTGVALNVTTSVGFAIIGALAAAPLAAGLGLSATAAAAASAAGVKVLQSGAEELGKAALGQDVTVMGSVERVVIDGTVAAATGAIATKLDIKVFTGPAQTAAKKVASKLTYFTAAQAQTMLTNFLAGSGQTVVISAATAAVEQVGEIAKKGKTPTTDDLMAAFEKFLIGALTAGFMKGVELGEEKFLGKAAQIFETKYVPDAVKKLVSGAMPSSADVKKIAQDVYKALKDDVGKQGIAGMVSAAKGDESSDKLADLGLKAIDADATIKRLIEQEVKAAMKKKKIPTK